MIQLKGDSRTKSSLTDMSDKKIMAYAVVVWAIGGVISITVSLGVLALAVYTVKSIWCG